METRIIGDLHGVFSDKNLMTPLSIQIGDLDLYGYKDWSFSDYPRFFIDGNHDNFSVLNPDSNNLQTIVPNLVYIPRGYVSNRVLFVGGAVSIDRKERVPGLSWFPAEELSQRQFHKIMSLNQPIEVFVTHDCGQYFFENYIPHGDNWLYDLKTKPARQALDQIFNKFHPTLWIFAHHHISFDKTINNCRFICIPANQHQTFDLPLSENMSRTHSDEVQNTFLSKMSPYMALNK